jgi:uroporphyrinogen III methyltransferase/synthase
MTGEAASPLPLLARRIAVAASTRTASRLAHRLAELGAEVTILGVVEIRALAPSAASNDALDRLERYHWIVFTSAHGVSHFLRLARGRGLDAAAWRGRRVCAIGPATARALEEAGVAVALVPNDFVAEGVVDALAAAEGGLDRLAGRRILWPRAREARAVLQRTLEAAGATVDVVACYENVLPEDHDGAVERLRASPPELLVFTSSSAVANFERLLGGEAKAIFGSTPVAALGPVTAATARSRCERVEIVPHENTVDALVDAIVEYFRQSD